MFKINTKGPEKYNESYVSFALCTSPFAKLTADFVMPAIERTAATLVEKGGYIVIERNAEIITANGKKDTMSYQTYITYMQKHSNGSFVSFYKDDKKMLEFHDSLHDDRLHVDYFGEIVPEKQIAALLTWHFMDINISHLSQDEIKKFKRYADNLSQQIEWAKSGAKHM